MNTVKKMPSSPSSADEPSGMNTPFKDLHAIHCYNVSLDATENIQPVPLPGIQGQKPADQVYQNDLSQSHGL